MSVALTEAQISSPGRRSECVEGGGGDLGGQRQRPGEADADAVAEPVDVGDLAAPRVAGAASRLGVPVQRDGVGPDDGERRPGRRSAITTWAPSRCARTPPSTVPVTRLTPTRSAT